MAAFVKKTERAPAVVTVEEQLRKSAARAGSLDVKEYPFQHPAFTLQQYPDGRKPGNYHYRGFAGLYSHAHPERTMGDFKSFYSQEIRFSCVIKRRMA